MPQTPEERRKTFEALAQKRQQLIDAERAKQVQREQETTELTKRQKQDLLQEQAHVEARGEAREEWRQEQHTKHEEELEAKRLAAAEVARQEAKKAKEAEAQEARTEKMHDLHDRAISQKVAARKLAAKHVEEETVGHVDDQLERDLRDVDNVLDRTEEHLVQDRRKKIAQLDDETTRQRISMTERFASKKKDAELTGGPRAGSLVLQITSEHKRALLTLEERTAETRAKIEADYNHLKEEAVAQAEQKKARLRGVAGQRLREAQTRHENMDEWIDSHRGVK